ncbi:Leucine-rich repeat receptor protein kinase msp1, partial [Thalictrum thalictroides]
FRSEAQLLPDDEVQTLGQIFSRLNNDYWNTSVDQYSCQTDNGLKIINKLPDPSYSSFSNVTCDCTFNSSTICHITWIELRNLRINAELPIDFADLTYLRTLDLSRNNFQGFIPKQWASLPLVYLSLLGNLITGTIPKEIGNIHTLEVLVFQDNNMEGPIPKELGNLVNLKRIWINGVSFSGKIPEFIGNWTKLERLDMQGTSMEGPIPSTISLLTNLRELRITDLRASNISFPDLRDLNMLTDLVLRNCSIIGHIPQYIGQNLTNIRNLDLSFNRYLTSNSLTGPVSQWLSDTNKKFDISYNNFNGSSQSTNCQANNLKKIASYSSLEDKLIDWCLKKDLPCPKNSSQYELFINCGGSALSFQGMQYEPDTTVMGPSSFYSDEKWACSTTGDFLDNELASYRATSTTGKPDDDIYSTARLAPFSLRYYGRCLLKGSYTVTLHFAEIVLTADRTNNTRGWGKRIFDIYIQGDKVWSDFNIAEEAGGIGKGIEKIFTANVTGSTLEVHLYWSGKGTTFVPRRSVYGPLISAISVTP